MAKRIVSASCIFFIIIVVIIVNPVLAYETHEGDIVLTGNQVLIIADTEYTQTGNIFVRDQAKLSIKNSTIIFNQRYHEEFAIYVQNNAVLELNNSTITTGILPEENYEIKVWGFRFNDFQGEFCDLKAGLKDFWHFQNGSYDITLENTNIVGDMGLHCDSPSEITVRNSRFFQLGCQCLSTISLRVIDSEIVRFYLHGFDNNCSGQQLSELKKGFHLLEI